MQKNDLFELEITDMGAGGEGIGRHEGMTFFVKDALIGDRILARATKLKKNYGYARVEEIRTPSTFRVTPKCPLHRQCGGCQIQALSYEKQLEYKAGRVRESMVRIGGFSEELIDGIMEPPVGMERPYRYRNKAQFPVGTDRDGNTATGFYAARTHSIIPVEDCLLGAEENRRVLAAVKEWMERFDIPAYDEREGTGVVRHILIRYGFTTKELMVCLIIRVDRLPQREALCSALAQIPGMTSISFNVNPENTNVILGKRTECIWGQPYITDYIHLRDCADFALTGKAVAYRISPQSFYQVNPVQTEKLYSTALEYAGLTGREYVWDLYCGIGTISLFLAQKAKQVYGVEVVPQAIEDAKTNARLNGITNAQFFVGRAEEILPEFYAAGEAEHSAENIAGTPVSEEAKAAKEAAARERSDMLRPDVIVVDPPRKGCDAKCLETMLRMQPARIVYVSCDPATLARDLRVLCDGGYRMERMRAFDQFPQSVHVETVVQLVRKTPDAYIDVTVDMDELDLTASEAKATYQEIKDYILEKHGVKVSSLYIAQIKQKYGIIERDNFNTSKSENVKQPHCPPEKEKAIMEELKYFGII